MTYLELQQAVLRYMHRIDTDVVDYVPFFIEQARTRINRDLRVPEMVKTVTFTPAANPTPLDTDLPGFLEARQISSGDNGRRYTLYNVGRETLTRWAGVDYTRPQYYSVDGGLLEFAPGGEGREYEAIYYKAEDELTLDAQENPTMKTYPSIWVHGSLVEAYSYTQDSELRDESLSNYNGEVQLANAQAQRRSAAGPLQMGGASQWV